MLRSRAGATAIAIGIVATSGAGSPRAADGEAPIFEVNVTNDLTLASGEPMIGVDPRNPRNLAVIEMTLGSKERPAWSYDQQDYRISLSDYQGTMRNAGRVLLSRDGGATWVSRPPPAIGGDPYLAYGPRGEIYAGAEGGVEVDKNADLARVAEYGNLALSVSTDGGRTFTKWQSAHTPIDRPWLSVDQSNGKVFTVSSGSLDLKADRHNARTPDSVMDRWLVAWSPRLRSRSEPRRLGGPDFSAAGGSTIAAAHNVVAATFVLGGPPPGGGAVDRNVATPIPASLQGAVNGAVSSCSIAAPCLFFETTADEGRSWSRHYVPVSGFNGQRAGVAADPRHAGSYTVSLLSGDRTNFLVVRTSDWGKTWSQPVTVPQATSNVKFKQWMAIGPSGVVGLVWKDRRDDLTPQDKAAQANQMQANRVYEAAFDVYAAISCDGGTSWTKPVRVNGETSPAGPPGSDDFAYLALDAVNAHLVWGDRRMQPKVTNVSGGAGGVQTFYARLPFTRATRGTACGTK